MKNNVKKLKSIFQESNRISQNFGIKKRKAKKLSSKILEFKIYGLFTCLFIWDYVYDNQFIQAERSWAQLWRGCRI